MEHLDFEPYFESDANKYYDSKYIVTILENILGNKLDDIKNEINNTQIVVTIEQITEYLGKKFEEENSELKKRIAHPQELKLGKNITELTDEFVEILAQRFSDNLAAQRYSFDPYTLKYFERCSNILRNKALLLLNIIEKIGNKNSLYIEDLISEFDIQLDENGNVLKEDIIRLITPTVYNIRELNEKVAKANDLSIYLTFKASNLIKECVSESDMYPSELIQIKSVYNDCIKGNIPLSNNQKIELENEKRKNIKEFAKILFMGS